MNYITHTLCVLLSAHYDKDPYLGVELDSKLNWNYHINSKINKASQQLNRKIYYRCLINRVVTFVFNYCFIVFDIYRRYFSVDRCFFQQFPVYYLRACQVLTFQLDVMVFRFSNTQLSRLDKLLFKYSIISSGQTTLFGRIKSDGGINALLSSAFR